MELLTAVNTVLPYLGEHIVTQVEGSRHPTVDLIVSAIDRQRLSLLASGWWFNEMFLTIPVNTDGEIDVPGHTLEVFGIDCNVVPRGQRFFNLMNGSFQFTKPITVKILTDWEFEQLPDTAALYVTYMAGVEVYTADLGVENAIQVMQSYANQNIALLRQSDLRNRRYNSVRKARSRSSYSWLRQR